MSDEQRFGLIVQFIRELYNNPLGGVPLHAPVFKGNEKKYLADCIDSTYVSYVGEFVTRFEQMVADYTGAKYAIAVVNGTVALQIALLVSGVDADDEVITQPLTFVATANAIRHVNAWPVFVDVDRDTLGMSPSSLEDFLVKHAVIKKDQAFNINTGRKIKAVVPMHTFGFPCRVDEIVEIALKYRLAVIEDSAESLGSYYKNKHTGTFGLAGIFSFNGNKIITTGGGGMIITDNHAFVERAKHLTTTAKVPHPWEFIHDEVGFNFRMPNVNAAIGVAQMENIHHYVSNKRETALKYASFFDDSDIDFVAEIDQASANYWLNTIVVQNREVRDEFLTYCNKRRIMTRPAWRLMNELDFYRTLQCFKLKNARDVSDKLLNLPSSIRSSV